MSQRVCPKCIILPVISQAHLRSSLPCPCLIYPFSDEDTPLSWCKLMCRCCAAGCSAFTRLMPTGDLLCPRWCITYKKGKSEGRHGCYGRMWYDEIQSTIVGRAEPHNLRLVHPWQHRVATIRENARCQVPCSLALVNSFLTVFAIPGAVKELVALRYRRYGCPMCRHLCRGACCHRHVRHGIRLYAGIHRYSCSDGTCWLVQTDRLAHTGA